MRYSKGRGVAFGLVLLGATALGAIGLGGVAATHAYADGDSSLDATAAVEHNFTPVGDFANLVKNVTPAVVSIDVHLKLDQTADNVGGDDSSGDGGDNGDSGGGMPPGFPGIPGLPPVGVQPGSAFNAQLRQNMQNIRNGIPIQRLPPGIPGLQPSREGSN